MMRNGITAVAVIVCLVVGYYLGSVTEGVGFATEMVEVFPKYKVYEYSERDVVCPDGNKPIHVMVGESSKEGLQEFYITCRELRSLNS